MFDAWAAGFLDAEGSYSLIKLATAYTPTRSGVLHRPTVAAGQDVEIPIPLLKAAYGGVTFNRTRLGRTGPTTHHCWHMRNRTQIRDHILRVGPLLVVKQEQARILLDYIDDISAYHGAMATREELYTRLKELNAQGRPVVPEPTMPLSPLLEIPEVMAAWTAGFLDGDGSVRIAHKTEAAIRTGATPTAPVVEAAQKVRRPLDLLADRYGGNVTVARHGMYHWTLYRRSSIRTLLTTILPHLTVKRAAAELLLKTYA